MPPGKSVVARCHDQHARRVRYPDKALLTVFHRPKNADDFSVFANDIRGNSKKWAEKVLLITMLGPKK
jgi:hypothetical protein